MMGTVKIPKSKLMAARRRLHRHVASVLIHGMAETDTSFTVIDNRLGKKSGWAKDYIDRLQQFKASNLREMAEFSAAMGLTLDLSIRQNEAME